MKTLMIPAMNCEHCIKRIGACLKELAVPYEIDLARQELRVTVSDEELTAVLHALADIGYEAYLAED